MAITALEHKRSADKTSDTSGLASLGTLDPRENNKDLASAFEVFSNVSAQLADSYQAMEQQVGQWILIGVGLAVIVFDKVWKWVSERNGTGTKTAWWNVSRPFATVKKSAMRSAS